MAIIGFIKRNVNNLRLPVLFLHGENDKLALAAGSQGLYDEIRHQDKEIRYEQEAILGVGEKLREWEYAAWEPNPDDEVFASLSSERMQMTAKSESKLQMGRI